MFSPSTQLNTIAPALIFQFELDFKVFYDSYTGLSLAVRPTAQKRKHMNKKKRSIKQTSPLIFCRLSSALL